MKKLFMQKILPFLVNWIRSRFARRSDNEFKFGKTKREKKLSPRYIHLLKMAQIFKSNLRQKI